MKKILILTLATMFGVAHGQQYGEQMKVRHAPKVSNTYFLLEFGPRVGVNYAMVSGVDGANGIPGFVGGGTIEFRTSRLLSFSLDIVYSAKGFFVPSNENKVVMSYIDAPLTTNFYFTERFSAKVGLQPALLMGVTRFTPDKNYDEKHLWQPFDLAIPVGLSYNIGYGFNADLRYNIGLLNTTKDNNKNIRNSTITFTLTKKFY